MKQIRKLLASEAPRLAAYSSNICSHIVCCAISMFLLAFFAEVFWSVKVNVIGLGQKVCKYYREEGGVGPLITHGIGFVQK